MAQKGLFFNAFPDSQYETGYDRNYSADDISDWLKAVITTGVIKTGQADGSSEPTGLKIIPIEGMKLGIKAGLAVIEGKPYVNDATMNTILDTAPTGASPRYDAIILRMNNTQTTDGRRTYVTKRSFDSVPTADGLARSNGYYDLMLAYVIVRPNVTEIQQSDIVDTRGDKDLCPWCTAIKGYEDYYDAIVQQFKSNGTMQSAGTSFVTDIASSLYNAKYSLVEVYTNGLREERGVDFEIDATSNYLVINFATQKSAGAEILVYLNNFIDGEGLSNVLDDYNQWVNDVENLKTANEFNYYCNGVNDNEGICDIVNAFFSNGEGRWYQTLKLNVIGKFGYTAPMAGDGSSSSPYVMFAFNAPQNGRRALIDFANAYNLEFTPTAGKITYIFSATSVCIKNADVIAINSITQGTSVIAFQHLPRLRAENCRFWIYGYSDSYIATRGEFVNCQGSVRNYNGDSFCFKASSNVYLSLIGGEYKAHTGLSNAKSAVVYSNVSSGITQMQDVIASKVDYTNLYQTNSIYHTAGKLLSVGLVSPLAVVSGSGATITSTISANPYDQLW